MLYYNISEGRRCDQPRFASLVNPELSIRSWLISAIKQFFTELNQLTTKVCFEFSNTPCATLPAPAMEIRFV
jgi:hypothetical protein